MTSEPTIAVRNLTKVYDHISRETVEAVGDVSFSVESGEFVSLLGSNGAGKSTVLKCILGLVRPTEGSVYVNGVDVAANPKEAYDEVAFIAEGARNIYWRMTVWENMRFFAGVHGIDYRDRRERMLEYLKVLGIENKKDTPVRDLSRGLKQRSYIACSLARGSDILVLDEPTLGLDVNISHQLAQVLRGLADEEDRTILLASHDMSFVEKASDRIIIMNDGEVLANQPVDQLLESFATDAYEIIVDGRVPESTIDTLRREYDVGRIDPGTNTSEVEVILEAGDSLHSLLGTLESDSRTVVSIDRGQPDLEDVYVQVAEKGVMAQ